MVIVPPGQKQRRKPTWTNLYRDMASGKCKIVVHVVAAGFHPFEGFSHKESRYYQAGQSEEEFLIEYKNECLNREVEVIKELVSILCAPKGPRGKKEKLWMITLVTKQDLWWDEREQLRKHYTEGAYNRHVEEILAERGKQNFEHVYLSALLVMSNFMTSKGELLANAVAGYDQPIQLANLNRLLETIKGFLSD